MKSTFVLRLCRQVLRSDRCSHYDDCRSLSMYIVFPSIMTSSCHVTLLLLLLMSVASRWYFPHWCRIYWLVYSDCDSVHVYRVGLQCSAYNVNIPSLQLCVRNLSTFIATKNTPNNSIILTSTRESKSEQLKKITKTHKEWAKTISA